MPLAVAGAAVRAQGVRGRVGSEDCHTLPGAARSSRPPFLSRARGGWRRTSE
jgi:hypothetical protein